MNSCTTRSRRLSPTSSISKSLNRFTSSTKQCSRPTFTSPLKSPCLSVLILLSCLLRNTRNNLMACSWSSGQNVGRLDYLMARLIMFVAVRGFHVRFKGERLLISHLLADRKRFSQMSLEVVSVSSARATERPSPLTRETCASQVSVDCPVLSSHW